jgi:uncharacterized protein (TIGR03083 family)
VRLLRGLPADAWEKPTIAGTWRVRDVVAHLVDGGMRRLSFHRDRHQPPAPLQPPRTEREFVAFINGLNARWIEVAARFSPRVLTDVYEMVGARLADFTEAFPDDGPALFPVSWAGELQSEGWFDLGREFTEVWHHQAQIRDAVGAPVASDPAWLHATLLIALRGLPHVYREATAAPGESIAIRITGASGGAWTLLREDRRWTLWAGEATAVSARVEMSDDTAWRLLFNALDPDHAASLVTTEGRFDLFVPLFRARSAIV